MVHLGGGGLLRMYPPRKRQSVKMGDLGKINTLGVLGKIGKISKIGRLGNIKKIGKYKTFFA